MITESKTALGLVTPGNSQESRDSSDDDEPIMNTTTIHSLNETLYGVEWIDTDASEDEDYLPQNQHTLVPSPPRRDRKRSRSNSREAESPGQRVRRAIDIAVDSGVDFVDLSCLGLTELPPEFLDVRYITVIKKDTVKNTALKLYLSGNQLTEFPSQIFALKNLSVLSLRGNRLEVLPPEIGLLQNLVEVSVGNNLLKYLPSELIELPLLTILNLTPNSYLERRSQPLQLSVTSVPSLVEIMSQEFLKGCDSTAATTTMMTEDKDGSSLIPGELRDRLASVSSMSKCHACLKKFCQPAVEQVVWRQVFGRPDIPIAYRYCSIYCSNSNNISINTSTSTPILTSTATSN
ncbi:hypothetical protein BDB00DRAFT_841358 [Zychaea mexicana]|uniref:uncharacterized protein n=1 Tax=Zychaea mexicana TaxID=64656 RepID=UPI0022FE2E1C|nr:uncharacterized protein BDB00DRAFT_841358 [Zychaea mexicana]KAI9489775.1 hypothetical protein BDB00DRAFT_841358 [Zychaea mexicana]